MARKSFFVGMLVMIALFGIVVNCSGGNHLNGTTWKHVSGFFFGAGWGRELTIDFGVSAFRQSDILTTTGTYKVSGDNITIKYSDGSSLTGTIIGNSLELGGAVFSRIK